MKTTLQAGMRILISRYLSSRGCGDTVYVTGPPGVFCPQTAIIASFYKIYCTEIMETNNMEMYEAPKVEIIEVEVEKGFAVSGGTEDYDQHPW